jgi:hypothetical protein
LQFFNLLITISNEIDGTARIMTSADDKEDKSSEALIFDGKGIESRYLIFVRYKDISSIICILRKNNLTIAHLLAATQAKAHPQLPPP